MPLDFPGSPSVNDVYSEGGRSWTWNGTSWVLNTYVGVVPPGSVGTTELAANAVTSAKIANTAINGAHIANTTITHAHLAANTAVNNLGFTPATTGKAIAMSIVFGG